MKDKDFETQFPWTLVFITCGLSYLGFIRLMRLLNVVLPPMFLWIGILSLLLGSFTAIISRWRNKKDIHSSVNLMNGKLSEGLSEESDNTGDH